MRINKFVAQATGLSRRAADQAIADGRVLINDEVASLGTEVSEADSVTLDGEKLSLQTGHTTIMLNKPAGYVVSRDGQGSQTIYDLLATEYQTLKPIGRLDKDSSGLLLLTDDGQLAQELTHPKYQKTKIYQITLDKKLTESDLAKLAAGVTLEDGLSHLQVTSKGDGYEVRMTEGRNRQIRRTFAALGYTVTHLHRTHFGQYELNNLQSGGFWQT